MAAIIAERGSLLGRSRHNEDTAQAARLRTTRCLPQCAAGRP